MPDKPTTPNTPPIPPIIPPPINIDPDALYSIIAWFRSVELYHTAINAIAAELDAAGAHIVCDRLHQALYPSAPHILRILALANTSASHQAIKEAIARTCSSHTMPAHWQGYAYVEHIGGGGWKPTLSMSPAHACIGGITQCTPDDARANLPILMRLAELMAAYHGATITTKYDPRDNKEIPGHD